MNTATKNLEDDHVCVIKLTDVMKAIVRSDKPEVTHIENIVDIIRNFAVIVWKEAGPVTI